MQNLNTMQRRQFLASTLAAPALITATTESAVAAPPAKPFVVKAGEARFGTHTPYQGINPNDLKISGKDTAGQLAMFDYEGNAKVGPPLHVHETQDEIFYIAAGEYLFQVGDEQFTAKAGDTVFGPRNVPHTWFQLSDKGRIVYLVQPAGQMEAFFLKMNELKGPPSPELAQQLHVEHGMKILGPPLR
jgi:quercetin dioxygenase-like cupin family protein